MASEKHLELEQKINLVLDYDIKIFMRELHLPPSRRQDGLYSHLNDSIRRLLENRCKLARHYAYCKCMETKHAILSEFELINNELSKLLGL